MTRRRSKHKGFFRLPTSFLDKLLILILVFLTIAILALILINPIVKKSAVDSKAEFIFDIEWDRGDHDVDIWAEDPLGNILSYNNQEAGLLNLDRDDTGNQRDKFEINGKKIEIKGNHETVTIRGIMPGAYLVNIHLYRASKYIEHYIKIDKPVFVTVRLTKVNPRAVVFFKVELPLEYTKEERHVASFEITEDGEVINVRTNEGRTLVYAESGHGTFFNDGSGVPDKAPSINLFEDDNDNSENPKNWESRDNDEEN